MSDYRIKISISNGRILKLMTDRGIETQTDLARLAGLPNVAINAIVKMRQMPKRKNGDWRDVVHRIATVLGVTPEELFTDTQANGVLAQSTFETDVSEAQMGALCGPDVATQLEHQDTLAHLMLALSDRERLVVTARLGDATYADVGAEIGTSGARAREIEMKAHRRMRKRAKNLQLHHSGIL